MPNDIDDFVIDINTGETVRLPTAYGSYMGLPKKTPVLPPYDPSESEGGGQRWEMDKGWHNPTNGAALFPLQPPHPDVALDNFVTQKQQQTRAVNAAMGDQAAFHYNDGINESIQSTKPPPPRPFVIDDPALREFIGQKGQQTKAVESAFGPETAFHYKEGINESLQPTSQPDPLLASLMAPRDQRAFIQQSAGPMGTINQIGQGGVQMPNAMAPQYATQADLDQALRDQAAAIPPPPPAQPGDPSRPEEAGMDLQQQGLGMQEKSAALAGNADVQGASAEEREIIARNNQVEAVRKETARRDAEWQKRRQEIGTNITKATDEWSKYKVDPGRRWKNASTGRKIGAAISIAMSALGDALQRKSGPNMAFEIINKAIEDDVSLQVGERQHLGDVAQRSRSSLDDYRRDYGDWQQARAAKLAEEYKRTADEMERISVGVKGDKAKANTMAMIGDLRSRAGALENGIATSAWTREMKVAAVAEDKRQARVGESQRWAGLAQSDRHFNANQKRGAYEFDETMKLRREELLKNQTGQVDSYLAKASAEQAKELKETGIKDPTTGQYIVVDGKAVMGRDVGESKEIQKTVNGTQTMLSTIDRIKAKIANDPGFAKLNEDEKQAALGSELESLTLLIKDAYGTGALDKGSIEFTNNYTGGDPTKLTSKGLFGALGLGDEAGAKTIAKLDVVARTAETRALNTMGNPKGYKFERAEELEKTPANKAAEDVRKGTPTTAAAARAAEPGGISKTLQDVESLVFGTEQKYKKDKRAAEETGGSVRYPGFRIEAEPGLDTIVAGVWKGDAQSATRLLEMVRDQKTPGLSEAAMTVVDTMRDVDPALYKRALAELPDEKRSYRKAIDKARETSNYKPPQLPSMR